MASSQVSMSVPQGPYQRLAAYRDSLVVQLGRGVTFGEAIERAVAGAEALEVAAAAEARARREESR